MVNHDLTEEDREKTKQYYIKEIKAAHYLGCRRLVIHPFFDALKEIGYDGCMSLETKIGAGMPKGIKEVWQKILGELAIYMAKRASGELPAPTE